LILIVIGPGGIFWPNLTTKEKGSSAFLSDCCPPTFQTDEISLAESTLKKNGAAVKLIVELGLRTLPKFLFEITTLGEDTGIVTYLSTKEDLPSEGSITSAEILTLIAEFGNRLFVNVIDLSPVC
jgi:hypothetical protein